MAVNYQRQPSDQETPGTGARVLPQVATSTSGEVPEDAAVGAAATAKPN